MAITVPLEFSQINVSGGVPPEKVALAVPLLVPWHVIFDNVKESIDGPETSFIITANVSWQPMPSVTTALYSPEYTLLIQVPTVLPGSSQIIVYGVMPPNGVTQALPLLELQVVGVPTLSVNPSSIGCVINTLSVILQLLASVIVTLYVVPPGDAHMFDIEELICKLFQIHCLNVGINFF